MAEYRIREHPILPVEPHAAVTFTWMGQPMSGHGGECGLRRPARGTGAGGGSGGVMDGVEVVFRTQSEIEATVVQGLLEHHDVHEVISNAMQAEREGYDAFLIGNIADPGLREAREIANMPVLGLCESAMHVACMMGANFSFVTINEKFTPRIVENVHRYKLEGRLAAVNRMTEALAVEWARFNINVNGIAPGAFYSEMMDGMLSRMGDITQRFPRQRLGDPATKVDVGFVQGGITNGLTVDGLVSLSVVLSAVLVSLGLRLGDPLVGLAMTVVILRVTWQSFTTVLREAPISAASDLVEGTRVPGRILRLRMASRSCSCSSRWSVSSSAVSPRSPPTAG